MSAPSEPAIRRGIFAATRLLPRVSRPLTAAIVACVAVSAIVPTLFKLTSGAIVGTLPRAIEAGRGSASANRALMLVAVSGALFACAQITGPVMQSLAYALGRRLTLHIRHRVMAATVGPPGIAHLEDPAVLDKIAIARGVSAADISPKEMVVGLTMVAARYATAIASGVLLAAFRWWLPLVLLVTYLHVMRAFRREFRKSADVLVGRSEAMRRSDYFRNLALLPQAAKELRVFGLHAWVVDRFRDAFKTAIGPVRRARRSSWRLQAWAPALFFLTEFATFSLLGRAALRGEISLGEFAVFTQAAFGLAGIASLSNHDLFIEYGAPAVAAALALEAVTAAPHIRLTGGRPAGDLPQHAIRFEGVTFRYPGQQREVLRDFSLDIPAGRSLAVVGDNGAGKTTLVKLLARLYDPTSGRITVDGIDVRELDPAQWQQRIGALFQDFVHYQLSVADNVAFGAADDDGLRVAGERAGALALIDDLPNGWGTVLSRQFTDGTDLSGGQWQRIALARAMYAVDHGAKVLVLDEPSANLDVRAEAELYDRFLELTAGLTTVLISHRFSTVRRADRIVVMDAGRVVEDGTHDDLVAGGGRYAAMFGMQAARFAP